MQENATIARLEEALAARHTIDSEHSGAIRVFNGFYEGQKDLVVDIYARTLVLFDYAKTIQANASLIRAVQAFYQEHLPRINCVVQKIRAAPDLKQRRGQVVFGGPPANQVCEHGIKYAVDLFMNQDASFYLDTRNLRAWLLKHTEGWRVLNTFAYTGSLGVAALAGGATQVIQVDRSLRFLHLALRSAEINHLDAHKMALHATDFFSAARLFKNQGSLFDCVILDPPFFSSTIKGSVDLLSESTRLINKLRPLVRDGGYLIAINNALFLSGAAYLDELEKLCQDGYLEIESLLPVPPDITGYSHTVVSPPPSDPNPFNHPTKITILRIKKKD